MNNFFYINRYFFIKTFFIILFIIPIVIYGLHDLEDYQLGFFSLKIFSENFNNYFLNYIDFYGPGINFPIGAGITYINPFNLFINYNVRLYYFLSIFACIFLQCLYLEKIIKFFIFDRTTIDNKKILLLIVNILIIFSITNFNNAMSDDWLFHIFLFSTFFISFYYFIKFIKKKKNKDIILFFLIITIQFSNANLGALINFYLFYLMFMIFNYKRIKFFFWNKYVYLSFFLLILTILSPLYNIITEVARFPNEISRSTQNGYSFLLLVKSFISPYIDIVIDLILFSNSTEIIEKILPFSLSDIIYKIKSVPINRMPGYGLGIIISLYFSYSIIKSKKSSEYYYLNILFILFLLISMSKSAQFSYALSAIWLFRDIVQYISFIFIFLFFYKNLINSKFINKILILILITTSISFYIYNVFLLQKNNKPNFINNVTNNFELKNYLNTIKKNEDKFNRVYLSPNIFPIFRNQLNEFGIYAVTDLTKYNLMPFNGWFKGRSLDNFYPSESVMHGQIRPEYKYFNNKIFHSVFRIKYFFYLKSEEQFINKENLNILKKIKFKNDEIIISSNKNYSDYQVLRSKKINNLKENKNIFDIFNMNYFESSDNIFLKRNKINEFLIVNKNKKEILFFFPFSESKIWKFTNNSSKKVINQINILNIPVVMLPPESVIIASANNLKKQNLKKLSIVSFVILLFLFFQTINKNKLRSI